MQTRKLLLTLLAILPVASISTAAYCQLNELAGEEQNDLLRAKIAKARRLLLPSGAIRSTLEAAKNRLAHQTGIMDEGELEEEFNYHVQILIDNGLVDTDEKEILAKGPSAW